MNKRSSLLYAILIMTFMWSAKALPQESIFFLGDQLGVGARAMGMGGAFVGVADDYSAIYWNPAGLGQIRRMEMNFGFAHNKVKNDALFLGNNQQADNSVTRLNSIGFVFPVPTYQGSLVFALGYNKVRDFEGILEIAGFNRDWAAFPDYFDQTYSYEDTEPYYFLTDVLDNLYQKESVVDEGSLNQFSFSMSTEVQRNFFLGFSLHSISGKDEYSLRLVESDDDNLHNAQPDTLEDNTVIFSDLYAWNYEQSINSDFSGTHIEFGALYQVGEAFRAGITIKPPSTYKIKEVWSDKWDIEYDNGDVEYIPVLENETEYKIKEPYTFTLGGSYKLSNLLLAADIEYKDWSQAKFETDPPIYGVSKSDINYDLKKNLTDVKNIRFGGELYLPILKSKIRAGYSKKPSPYKEKDLYPDKDYITAGASIMLDKQVMLDLAYMNASWKQTTTDAYTNAPTDEDVSFNKLVGTISIRF